jgi:hypothetical protein
MKRTFTKTHEKKAFELFKKLIGEIIVEVNLEKLLKGKVQRRMLL